MRLHFSQMIRLYLLILICGLSRPLFGQSEAMYAQYMFNGLAINPAYAGSHDALSLSFLARFQGVGIEGMPNTQTFSGHTALNDERMGVGLIAINDQLGVTRQTGAFGSYSYTIHIQENARLALGLQAGVNFIDANYSELKMHRPGDPIFVQDVQETRPNFGSGVLFYNKLLYAGLSMPQMLGAGKSRITQLNPVMLNGGFIINAGHAVKVKPNFMVKMIDSEFVEYNINTNVLFQEVLWVGASYRPNNSLNFLVEALLTSQLRLGYAYETSLNDLHKYTGGSHEVMLNYRFRFTKKGAVDPRYF